MNTVVDTVVDEKIKVAANGTQMYKVILLNDDVTPMEFVVSLIMKIFKHQEAVARELTIKIHQEGSGVVGVYHYEIAEQKAIEATVVSRDNGFPLRAIVEEE